MQEAGIGIITLGPLPAPMINSRECPMILFDGFAFKIYGPKSPCQITPGLLPQVGP